MNLKIKITEQFRLLNLRQFYSSNLFLTFLKILFAVVAKFLKIAKKQFENSSSLVTKGPFEQSEGAF
jgi:hypothetical protein